MIAQAPTGFGKSFAALVPAIIQAVKAKKRVVISTETIGLQDQYIGQDLPLLHAACAKIGVGFTFAVAKGRSNYICRLKLDEEHDGSSYREPQDDSPELRRWAALQQVGQHTGDMASVPFPVTSEQWRNLGADEDCERKACPFYGEGKRGMSDCFIYDAQRRYAEADIVVTNPTLLLLDAQIGAGSLFGQYGLLIVDEGHTIPEQAQRTWGMEIRARTVTNTLRFCDKLLRKVGVNHFESGFLEPFMRLEDRVFEPFRPLMERGGSFYIKNIRDAYLSASKDAARVLADQLVAENKLLKDFCNEGTEAVIDTAREKIGKLVSGLRRIYGDEVDPEHQDNWISFLETHRTTQGKPTGALHLKPIDVAPLIKAMILDTVPNVVFMSATMFVNGSFRFMKKELGLDPAALEFTGETPFDYRKNVEGYFPTDLPDPTEEDYVPRLARRIKTIINRRGGKALILFTSNQTMRDVYRLVHSKTPHTCFIQGDASKDRLLQLFKEDIGSCLFATKSYFTGVDVPGEACSTVVLTRAPFRVPTDPLFRAKCEKIKERGGDDFNGYALPLMLMDVMQGFGRLIRTTTDTGLFCFLDSRANKKSYGVKIRKSLPPIRVVDIVQ
jgi:ATP-dependent DNA helicase DinG